jgi:hypothetical protein
MQVPSFELYEMRPQLALQLRKTSSDAATSSTLGVLALNALGRGGIGDGWQTGGLNSTAVRVECTADAPVACFADGGCETVWLQSGDCSGHNATLVTLIGKTLAPAVAQLHLSFAARSLRERLYSFFLHVPVWNGIGWQFASIDARLQIHAVADAQRSEVRVGRANEVDLPGSVVEVSHLDQLVVEIGARDVDGAPIHRMGERIAVQIVSLERKPNLTELAQFDADRVPPVYVQHRAAWGVPGALGYRYGHSGFQQGERSGGLRKRVQRARAHVLPGGQQDTALRGMRHRRDVCGRWCRGDTLAVHA